MEYLLMRVEWVSLVYLFEQKSLGEGSLWINTLGRQTLGGAQGEKAAV